MVRYKHVEGHQRNKYPNHILDEWAEMNEQMDGLAKAYLNHSRDFAPLSGILTHDEWYVRLEGTKIHKDLKTHVSQYLRSQAVRTLWTTAKYHQQQITPPRFTLAQLDLLDNPNMDVSKDSFARWRPINLQLAGT